MSSRTCCGVSRIVQSLSSVTLAQVRGKPGRSNNAS